MKRMLSGRRILTANEDPFTPRLSRILCGIRMSLPYILLLVLSRSSSSFSVFPVAYKKIIYICGRKKWRIRAHIEAFTLRWEYAICDPLLGECSLPSQEPQDVVPSIPGVTRAVSSLDARSSIARYRRCIITNKCRACMCSNPHTRD